MSDDIVTRLKWLGCQYDNSCITCEAADEIERLRVEIAAWRKVAHNEHAAWSQCPSNCLCLSNDFRKARQEIC